MGDEDIRETFSPLGHVSIRRLFGGKGVYFEGVIVAIVYGEELRLKADAVSASEFRGAGASQWVYEGRRGEVLMPYWSVPDEAVDDPEAMGHWLRAALGAALRNRKAPRRRKTAQTSDASD